MVGGGGELAQRLIDVAGGGFARQFPGEVDAGGNRGVRGDSGERAQLVDAESQDIVEPGIDVPEIEGGVELLLPAEHARRQLVGETAIAGFESLQRGIERRAQ